MGVPWELVVGSWELAPAPAPAPALYRPPPVEPKDGRAVPPSKSRSRGATAAPKAQVRRKRRWLRYLIAGFTGPLLLIVAVLGLLLRHPVAGHRGAAARRGRALLAADLRPAAGAAGRPVDDRGRPDRAAQRSRLRRPAAGHRSRRSSRSGTTPSSCRSVAADRTAGRPGRVRAGRRQARDAGDGVDPAHRAGRRRRLARPRRARAAAPDRARHGRPREAAQGAAGADPQARARRRCWRSRIAASTTIPAST